MSGQNFEVLKFELGTNVRCKNIGSPPKKSLPSIDIHGVKRDLDKKHWCIPYHLTQSYMSARTLNQGTLFSFTPVQNLVNHDIIKPDKGAII